MTSRHCTPCIRLLYRLQSVHSSYSILLYDMIPDSYYRARSTKLSVRCTAPVLHPPSYDMTEQFPVKIKPTEYLSTRVSHHGFLHSFFFSFLSQTRANLLMSAQPIFPHHILFPPCILYYCYTCNNCFKFQAISKSSSSTSLLNSF